MKIGTRGSALALIQAETVARILSEALSIATEIVIIKTQGDRFADRPLHELEGRGYFTREIEEALLDGQIDMAVHSFKDMPLKTPAGLTLAAISVRENPSDLLIIRQEALDDISPVPCFQERSNGGVTAEKTDIRIPLSESAVVGTSAVRRAVQLKCIRPDLVIKDLRGNVTTRLEKLKAGQYDAIFLAAAGVNRLNLSLAEFNIIRLDPTVFVPSPGQGALAIQTREDAPYTGEVHKLIHHETTGKATSLEREVMARFGGGCGLPLGVYARLVDQTWELYGFWGNDMEHPVWADVKGYYTDNLAEKLYRKLSGFSKT